MRDTIKIGTRVKTRQGMGNVLEARTDAGVELVKVILDQAPPHGSDIVWIKARDVRVLESNGD